VCERYEKQELVAQEVDPIIVAGILCLLHWLHTSLSKYHAYGLASLDEDVQALVVNNDVVCVGFEWAAGLGESHLRQLRFCQRFRSN
jgi:hypothetical protein